MIDLANAEIIGAIEDLAQYIVIMEDGRYSSAGFKVFYNPKSQHFLYQKRNKETSYYMEYSLNQYLHDMLKETRNDHFKRYLDGFIKSLKTPLGEEEMKTYKKNLIKMKQQDNLAKQRKQMLIFALIGMSIFISVTIWLIINKP